MSRTSLFLAALLTVPACDSGAKTDATAAKDAKATPSPAPATPTPVAEAKPDPADAKPDPADQWKHTLESRVLADSGLAKDGKLMAFDIVNCESGEKYCQVCRFGSSPKIMAVGTIDDEAFHKDLKDLDAMVKKYGDDKVKAFAVVTEIVDGKGITPTNVEEAQKKANELREKLAISIPVVIPSPGDQGANREWNEYYNITQSRTVMFADGRNAVQYSAVGPEDFSELDAAITAVIQS